MPNKWFSIRFLMLLLIFVGMINVYTLRVILNMTIVAMVRKKKIPFQSADGGGQPKAGQECFANHHHNTNHTAADQITHFHNITTSDDHVISGEFDWNSEIQSQVIGSFFYGYFLTNFIGGSLSEKVGAKWTFGLGILGTAVTSLLIPVTARYSVSVLIGLRVLQGLLEGPSFPSLSTMISRWFPGNERGFAVSICYNGSRLGTVIAGPVVGILCQSNIMGGWPSAFYIFGGISILWFIFWLILYHETPSEHFLISKAELNYILDQQGDERAHKGTKVPWLSILSSYHIWAIIVCEFCEGWSFNLVFSEFPTYMHNMMGFDPQRSNSLMAYPYILNIVLVFISGYTADLLLSKRIMRRTKIRKLYNSLGMFLPSVCVVGIIISGCNQTSVVAMFIMVVGLIGICTPGYRVAIVDMAPDFAGSICGLANGIGNISGFLVPISVGAITASGDTLANWAKIFWMTFGFLVTGGLSFLIGSTAELQPWGLAKK